MKTDQNPEFTVQSHKEKGNLRSLFLCRGEIWILNLFLGLLALAPLPFGSNRGWASDFLGLGIGGLLLGLWGLHTLRGPASVLSPLANAPWRRLGFASLAVAFVTLWGILQTSPLLPSSWAHPFWQEVVQFMAQAVPSLSITPRVSLTPAAMPEALVRILSYAGCFLLGLFLGRQRNQALRLLQVLAVAGMGYALYGLCVQASGTDTILWYKKWAHTGFLTATFANKNSYATYAGLGFLCSLAVLRQHFKERFEKSAHSFHKANGLRIFANLKKMKFEKRDILPLLSPLVILSALVLSGSRAGVFSAMLGGIVFFLGLGLNQRWGWRRLVGIFGGFVLVLSLLVSLGGDELAIRIQSDQMGEDSLIRLEAYRTALDVIKANPFLGYGLGSFDAAFGIFRQDTVPLWFQHAHNDYLEMMIELGIPVAVLFFSGVVALVSCCVQGSLQRKRDAVYPVLGVAATVIVGTHGMVDFSLQIPAIAATYAAILGLGVAQSYSSRGGDPNSA